MTSAFVEALPDIRIRQVFASRDNVDRFTTGGSVRLPVAASTAYVAADMRMGRPEVRIEFSAPSILHGHNRDALPADLIGDVVDVVLTELAGELSGLPSLAEVRFTRIDATRDFDDVGSTTDTLRELAAMTPDGFGVHSYYHRVDGNVQSIVRGRNRRWRSTTYDKGYERAEKAASTYSTERRELLYEWSDATTGRLRFESRVGPEIIKERGLHDLAAFNGDKLRQVAERHFAAANIGALLSGGHRLRDLAATLDRPRRRGLLAYLAAGLLGVDIELSHNTLDSYRAISRRLGLTPNDLVSGDGEPRRLDIACGRELTGDAALRGLVDIPSGCRGVVA